MKAFWIADLGFSIGGGNLDGKSDLSTAIRRFTEAPLQQARQVGRGKHAFYQTNSPLIHRNRNTLRRRGVGLGQTRKGRWMGTDAQQRVPTGGITAGQSPVALAA